MVVDVRYRIVLDWNFFRTDSTLTHVAIQSCDSTQHFTFLGWLNADSTQIPILLTWLDSDSTHLSQSWVKSGSRLITVYTFWPKFVDRGGGMRSNVAVVWFFPCKATDTAKSYRFLFRKISDSALTPTISSWLNSTQVTISAIRIWLDSCVWFSQPT